MATHTLKWSCQTPGSTQTIEKALTGSGQIEMDESVATGQVDKEIAVSIDVSQVVSFELYSDVAITVETNATDGGGGNTLALIGGIPYRWCTNWYDTFKFTVDITKMYITNASGSTANITLRVLYDATP